MAQTSKRIADRDWCAERLAAGDTVTAIAAQAEVSRQTASAWLKRHGLSAAKQPLPRPSAEQLAADYARHGSTRPMAAAYGIAPSTVRTWLFEAGVELNEPATSGGRPRVEVDVAELHRLRGEGLTLHQVAERLGVSYETVRRRAH